MTRTLVDFLLITALEEELKCLLDRLPGYRKIDPVEDDPHTYYRVAITAIMPSGAEAIYSIIACGIMSMGRVNAAAFASTAIQTFKPRFVILIGIAGGVTESGASLGDILISDQIVDYELQKHEASQDVVRYSVHRTDPRLLGAALNFTDEMWIDSLPYRPSKGKPRRRVGPIATGDKVVARKKLIDRYRRDWPQLIGVEMEAGGVATAVYQAPSKPGFFMVRSVSDLADEKKDTSDVAKWREYACAVAAAYSIALLRSGPVPPTEAVAPLDSNLDHAVRHTLQVDLSTSEAKTRIDIDLSTNEQEGIFGAGGLCVEYPRKPRPDNCFLAADAQGLDDLNSALSSALGEFGITPIKAADLVVPGALLCKIAGLIRETRFGVYELTTLQDRNLYLQLGIAIGLRRPFLLLKHRGVEPAALASGLDYYPVESYLELRFGLKHSVRDVIVSMSHYEPFRVATTGLLKGVLVEHGDVDEVDFAYAVAKSLNCVGLKPIFRQLNNSALTVLESANLPYHLLEDTAANQLHQMISAIGGSQLTIIRIDEHASPDAALTLGVALAQNRSTLLVHASSSSIPSSVMGLTRIKFANFSDLSTKLDRALSNIDR